MTLDKLIKAVMKYMDERGMLEGMKKHNAPPSGSEARSETETAAIRHHK